jgi:hypothetical protein
MDQAQIARRQTIVGTFTAPLVDTGYPMDGVERGLIEVIEKQNILILFGGAIVNYFGGILLSPDAARRPQEDKE